MLEDLLHPYGSVLAYSTDGGSNYTDLVEIVLATPPDLQRDEAKATVLDSPAFAEECVPSWIKLGEMPFEVFYTEDQFEDLLGFFFDGPIYHWRISLPLLDGQVTPGRIVVRGFLNKFKLSEAKAEENNLFSSPSAIRIATADDFAYTPGS